MIQPRIEDIAPLIAQTAEQHVPLGVVGDNHAAFAGRHLLVGIKGEDRCIGHRARAAPLILRTDRLAGVFDQVQIVAARDLDDGIHIRRLAESVHGDDGFGTLGDRIFNQVRIDIPGQRINIDEHRGGALVQHAVRRSNKAERGRNNLIARPDACRDHRQVQPTGTRVHRNAVLAACVGGERTLELIHLGSQGEPLRREHFVHGIDLGLGDVG